MRCRATTAKGEPCRRSAAEGTERCFSHSGGAVGRPDGLSEEIERRILAVVRTGADLAVAAEAAGISRSTLHRWRARGEGEGEGRFFEFEAALARAEAEAEARLVALIARAGERHWQAAAWLLPRRFGERWSLARQGRPPSAEPLPTSGAGSDLDASDPDTRRLLSELLRRRPADRSG
jgi:hypothetical protein